MTFSKALRKKGIQIKFGDGIDILESVRRVLIFHGHFFSNICGQDFAQLHAELIKGINVPDKGFKDCFGFVEGKKTTDVFTAWNNSGSAK